ncbi:HAMP domain-containing protein [Spirochaetales bacterium NM-380-WT-3C1]|uniref:HAMP domain-containing protein n=1 Tax=Bullifex porci TaxID=2606638 RepID=A0A7X2PC24_9SPIO|nr:histidine kinase [Bullifex porci]MSU06150.1 HAMP domain-containing protein [Bullifex porci]
MIKKRRKIFVRFTIIAIFLGLMPLLLVVLGLFSAMENQFTRVMSENYLQMVSSLQDRFENSFNSYDSLTKLTYYYTTPNDSVFNIKNFYSTSFRELINNKNSSDVEAFLNNILNVDSSVKGIHFITTDDEYHMDRINTFISDEDAYYDIVKTDTYDPLSRYLMIYPPHETNYFPGNIATTFTVARNYFNTSASIDSPEYIGTLFIDVDVQDLRRIVSSYTPEHGETIVFMVNGECWLSSDPSLEGKSFDPASLMKKGDMMFYDTYDRYGMGTYIIVTHSALFASVSILYSLSWLLLAISTALFVGGMIVLSRRLSKPLDGMMKEMKRLERGDFDISLPVEREDEIGELSQRFNEMSRALNEYVDKVYRSQLKQREAECTALKSQIYPHFLYNTLEVIRMTAISNKDEKVALMIESLSEQIHYLIGPVSDFVPLSKEIDIVEKYVFLLNARISGHIDLSVSFDGLDLEIPKLILQPIVENAYIHGIKPNGGSGRIAIEVERRNTKAFIRIMNNGVGMTPSELEELKRRFESDAPGIRDEYNWKSIGLKNVYDRLELIYGKGFGLDIESLVDVGTVVTITVPNKEYMGDKNDKTHNG